MEMIDNDDIINVEIYGGRNFFSSKKKDQNPYKVQLLTCESKHKCSLYSKGQCMGIMNGLSAICPEGKRQKIQGSNYGTKKWGELLVYKEHPKYSILEKPKTCYFFTIGDKFYLDVTYGRLVDNGNGIDFEDPLFFSSSSGGVFPIHYLTPSLIRQIINHRPQAVMGGTIKAYINEILPLIMENIREYAPDVFEEFLQLDESYAKSWGNSIIGKEAYVHSLKSGCVIKQDGIEFKVYKTFMEARDAIIPNMPFGAKTVELKIRITPEMTYVIDSLEQVDRRTKYVEDIKNEN